MTNIIRSNSNIIGKSGKEGGYMSNSDKEAKKCVECGKAVWYPTALFCKTCSIEFYNGKNDKETSEGGR